MVMSSRNFCIAAFGAAATVLVSSCSGTTPERAYLDARAQMGHKKAGFDSNRDPQILLSYAANYARGDDEVRRYNRVLGNYYVDQGQATEGYRALEKAAIAGDESAGRRVARAHYAGQYQPADVALIAASAYLPAAQNSQDTTVRLLLARLVAAGEVSGDEFKTQIYWLESAAALGSRDAVYQLAENAEASGNIAAAAAYYARVDSGSAKDRALRQARDHYLGTGRHPNARIGRAWLQRLRSMDGALAAQLAARIYRKTEGRIDADYLEATAAAGGVTNLQGGSLGRSRVLEQYLAAKTDAEREKILEPLRKSAARGDAASALTLARVLLESGGDRTEILDLVLASLARGNKDALPVLLRLSTITDRSDKNAAIILSAVEASAEKGNVAAAKQLSMIYSIGGIAEADQEKSRVWLKRAADAGDSEAQYQIGVVLWTSAKSEEEKTQARAYIEKSAGAGNVAAQTYLETAIVPAGSN